MAFESLSYIFNLTNGSPPHGHEAVNTGNQFAYHSRSEQKYMARYFRLARYLPQGFYMHLCKSHLSSRNYASVILYFYSLPFAASHIFLYGIHLQHYVYIPLILYSPTYTASLSFIRQTASAAMPSSLPAKSSFSVVVALQRDRKSVV